MLEDGEIMINLIILSIIVGLAFIVFLIVTNILGKQRKNVIRIETAKEQIIKTLDDRQNLLTKMEDIINKNTEVKQNNFENFNKEDLSNFELDKKLSKIADTFKKIKSDYQIELDTEDFRKLLTELKMNEEKNEASKKYYNKYAENLNNEISHFPSNIIAKMTKTKKKDTFDISEFKYAKNDIVFESEI